MTNADKVKRVMKGCNFDQVQRDELLKMATEICAQKAWTRIRWTIVAASDESKVELTSYIDGKHLKVKHD